MDLRSPRDCPLKQSHDPWKMSMEGFLSRKEAGCARWAKQGISSADIERDLFYFSSMGYDKVYGPLTSLCFLYSSLPDRSLQAQLFFYSVLGAHNMSCIIQITRL